MPPHSLNHSLTPLDLVRDVMQYDFVRVLNGSSETHGPAKTDAIHRLVDDDSLDAFVSLEFVHQHFGAVKDARAAIRAINMGYQSSNCKAFFGHIRMPHKS